jgi:hypothetical protein
MAYFPKKIMPTIVKKNASNVGSITADDYKTLSDEIIAIENFLGTNDKTASDADTTNILNNVLDSSNIIPVTNMLVDQINTFTTSGISTSSGCVHSGQRLIFPETSSATFLTKAPETKDKAIKVSSTIGFPDSGIITILNDFDSNQQITPMEWIKYSGKTSTEFLNCERGYLGTTIGSHNGVLSNNTQSTAPQSTSQYNQLDQAVTLPLGYRILNRRYPTWRYKKVLSFKEFRLVGTFVEMTRNIRLNPEEFDLTPRGLGDNYTTITTAANTLGILATRADGKQILLSTDPTFQALHQLTWTEAKDFVTALETLDIITVLKNPGDWTVGVKPFIPVFDGQVSVEYSLSDLTINPTTSSDATPPDSAVISPVIINATTSIPAIINEPFNFFVEATGITPINFDLTGALPAGLSFSIIPATPSTPSTPQYSAHIFGTPTVVGQYPVTVTASNGLPPNGSKAFIIDIAAATGVGVAPSITSPLTANGVVGEGFACTLTATGTAPIIFTAEKRNWATISGTELVGIPTGSGIFTVTIRATNQTGTDTKEVVITVKDSIAVTPNIFSSINIVQTADGRVSTKITSNTTQLGLDQNVIGYKTFHIGNIRTSEQRNAV